MIDSDAALSLAMYWGSVGTLAMIAYYVLRWPK